MRDIRQQENEDRGLWCYYDEDNPREWSLWRESDDTQLTPWMDLGPDGMIWAVWDQGDELVVVLEQRDDAATPPVLRQALMHLPSGKRTDFVFAGDRPGESEIGVERVHMGNDALLLLAFPAEYAVGSGVLGAALYDQSLRELIGPCIAWINPCGARHELVAVALRQPDVQTVRYGVFDYVNARYVVPAEYAEVFEHRGRWMCNTPDGRSQVRAASGEIVHEHGHTLHRSADTDGSLYAERDGRWGRADEEGRIVVEPYAPSWEALAAEIKRFERLDLTKAATPALCLDDDTLRALIDATGDEGFCVKYEGVEIDGYGGDGMLDVAWAELPGEVRAVLLEDRYGELRLLVLAASWHALPAGSVLKLTGKARAGTVAEGGDEDAFLQTVFAQSIEMDGW